MYYFVYKTATFKQQTKKMTKSQITFLKQETFSIFVDLCFGFNCKQAPSIQP